MEGGRPLVGHGQNQLGAGFVPLRLCQGLTMSRLNESLLPAAIRVKRELPTAVHRARETQENQHSQDRDTNNNGHRCPQPAVRAFPIPPSAPSAGRQARSCAEQL